MSQKKLPVTKSTEELLKDLEVPEEIVEEKIESKDTVITFLRFYNIEPGLEKIHQRQLYKLYKEFTENPLIQYTFAENLSLYIPWTMVKEQKVYLINQKAMNLSEKALEFLDKQTKHPRHKALPSQAHFKNFVDKYNIKRGTGTNWIWVSAVIFYNLYDKWTYSIKKKSPFSEKSFRDLCKLYFEHKEDPQLLWFKLNISICQHLSREMDKKYKARKRLPHEKKEEST